MKLIDLTGKQFENITVLHRGEDVVQNGEKRRVKWLWRCKCGVCGDEFIALPAKINSGHITSCGCAIQSTGERYVLSILKELGASYIEQYSFKNCKYKQSLRFDFAIFDNNKLLYLIEYDGKQHFEPINWFGGLKGFEATRMRDNIKNEFCKKYSIPLLRIPYALSDQEIKQKIYEYHLSVTTAGCV